MRTQKLDKISYRILQILQSNSNITNTKLAEMVGISAPPCLRRVRMLEENGFIASYNAHLNPKLLNFNLEAFIMVRLHSQAENDLLAFEEHVRTLSYVRTCHMINGEMDFILKCIAPDLQTFQDFHLAKLASLKNVKSLQTSLIIRETKKLPEIPFETLKI